MKTIKSALLGNKQLIDTNPDVLLLQIREILKEHRELIITRMISDLPTYIIYKFNVKPNRKMVETVKDQLLDLKKGNVDLDKYSNVVQMVLNRAVTHLTNEPFYVEIDEYLEPSIQVSEVKFG
ncbi:MAG: hypothetical protein IM606_01355 [Cytophagales bacterium]|jgi:hypothetical protein|nr:hypothetical protein [Cytophagales bacterium]MCA6387649.1 hypothetical protein [Cytophagales bacterium]MCA6392112.1 hypothetical protein [Cytophagales bacterium]MCA6393811.1 hypothetical protein [Cytophagales bacterium]MCA6399673.1 hypothetical protein [Cytophagales bacterium]